MALPAASSLAYAIAMTLLFRLAALVLLAGIVYATLAPIELRPHAGGVETERFAAFLAFGLCLALGFPRRPGLVLLAVAVTAVSLELAQLIDPSRHGRLGDALVKLAGGWTGAVPPVVLRRLRRRDAP
jgi:hypothetical protein